MVEHPPQGPVPTLLVSTATGRTPATEKPDKQVPGAAALGPRQVVAKLGADGGAR